MADRHSWKEHAIEMTLQRDEALSKLKVQAEEIERLEAEKAHLEKIVTTREDVVGKAYDAGVAFENRQLRSQEPVAWMVESQFNGRHGARVTFYDEGEAARYVMELQSINGWTATIRPLIYAAPPDGEEEGDG